MVLDGNGLSQQFREGYHLKRSFQDLSYGKLHLVIASNVMGFDKLFDWYCTFRNQNSERDCKPKPNI